MTENFGFLADEKDIHMNYQNYLLFSPKLMLHIYFQIPSQKDLNSLFLWMNLGNE